MMYSTRFGVLLSFIPVILLCGCDSGEKTPLTGKSAGRNVLFITYDTTRVDRFGCYGHTGGLTPTTDALAKKGVVFENAYAQAPLTLVSHTCMMTGLFPKEHGIRDNGSAPLADSHPTLAALFKGKGYKTAAFVATYVLEKRFGLARGFDTYDDDMGKVELGAQLIERQRPGNIVTDRAVSWLNANKSGPFFCWVHYYDPHDPYRPPEEFRKNHANPYDGEIAFMDSQTKRLVDWLEANKLAENTTIVIIADHGEALGEHGEKTHAMFLYDASVHVPFIVVDPAVKAGHRVNTYVEVADIFTTLVDMAGLPKVETVKSRCLSPLLAGASMPDQDCYSESHSLFNSHNYAEQRCLTTRQWKYISSAKPELYDMQADRHESKNLIAQKPDVAKEMKLRLLERFDAWTAGQTRSAAPSEETRKALEALGYISGGSRTSTEFLTEGLPDPKDMLPVITQLQEANSRIHANRHEDALPLLEDAARKSPKSFMIHYTLGATYLHLHRLDEAFASLERGLKLETKYPPLFVSMGDAKMEGNKPQEALQHYTASLATDDANPAVYYKIALCHKRMQREDKAIEALKKAVSLRPDYAEALYELGYIHAEAGKFDESVKYYRDAVKVAKDDASTHYNLALALLRSGKLPDAEHELREAVKLKDDYGDAWVNLGICLGMQGRFADALVPLQRAAAIPASSAEGYFNLGVTYQKMDNVDQAAVYYEKAFEYKPGHLAATESLARLYIKHRRLSDAIRVLRAGVAASPDNLKFTNMLAEMLSTAQDERLRDGATALRLILPACEASQFKVPGLLATLAAAYAETGDFDKAVDFATKALQGAESANQQAVVEFVRPQLEQFQKKQPYRNPKY
ncbi:MAG: sulfatase-like hydrolase/transferase [Planctomycetes bacterium]|nr:sulfatase-like hydrolase/transferase [Planctomycetota bacterium]